jgi:hypothetical protein
MLQRLSGTALESYQRLLFTLYTQQDSPVIAMQAARVHSEAMDVGSVWVNKLQIRDAMTY